MWDNSTDSWFADEPVVLEFSQDRLELTFAKFDELSVGWNSIDLHAKPNWWGCYDELDLEWRQNGNDILSKTIGLDLQEIYLIEMNSVSTIAEDRRHPENVEKVNEEWLLHALEFKFSNSVIAIYNALDENGIQSGAHTDPDYRRVHI